MMNECLARVNAISRAGRDHSPRSRLDRHAAMRRPQNAQTTAFAAPSTAASAKFIPRSKSARNPTSTATQATRVPHTTGCDAHHDAIELGDVALGGGACG